MLVIMSQLFIIIMETCKAPTLLLKMLNKHNVTHNVHRGGNVISNKIVCLYIRKKKKLTHNVDKGSSITMQNIVLCSGIAVVFWNCMHAHTHTHISHLICVLSPLCRH